MPYQGELQSQFSAAQCSGISGSVALTVAAAGATQATATLLAAVNNLVTSATAVTACGVILPASKEPFDQCNVASNVSNVNIYIYPPVGGNLNGQATNAPCIMASNAVVTFFSLGGNNWLADSI